MNCPLQCQATVFRQVLGTTLNPVSGLVAKGAERGQTAESPEPLKVLIVPMFGHSHCCW
jgi:hypothetical protein